MVELTITKRQARRFILARQGLWPPYDLEGKPGVLGYIRRVGCIQFDFHLEILHIEHLLSLGKGCLSEL